MSVVEWYKIPLVGLPEFACMIDVDKDGRTLDADGEPLDKSDRPFKCGAEGHWIIGDMIFLCQNHAAEVATLMGDNIDDILVAWKAQL